MSDISKQIDEMPDPESIEDLMKLDAMLSQELREQAGQNEHVAKMVSQPGDLMGGKTAAAIKRMCDEGGSNSRD